MMNFDNFRNKSFHKINIKLIHIFQHFIELFDKIISGGFLSYNLHQFNVNGS